MLRCRLLPVQDMDALMEDNSCQKAKLRPRGRGDNLGRSAGDWQGRVPVSSLKAERTGAGGRAQGMLESEGLNFVLAVDKMLVRLYRSVVKIQI